MQHHLGEGTSLGAGTRLDRGGGQSTARHPLASPRAGGQLASRRAAVRRRLSSHSVEASVAKSRVYLAQIEPIWRGADRSAMHWTETVRWRVPSQSAGGHRRPEGVRMSSGASTGESEIMGSVRCGFGHGWRRWLGSMVAPIVAAIVLTACATLPTSMLEQLGTKVEAANVDFEDLYAYAARAATAYRPEAEIPCRLSRYDRRRYAWQDRRPLLPRAERKGADPDHHHPRDGQHREPLGRYRNRHDEGVRCRISGRSRL